jgi:replicative DNA helicase
MSDAKVDQLPPQNRDAERSVLGSMLRDNEIISDVIPLLRADYFYYDAHQKIYQTMAMVYDSGQPVDVVILAEKLRAQNQIEDIGGYAYLAELWDATPTAANAVHYARIVRDKAMARHLIHATTTILKDAYDQVMPSEQLVESAERQIMEIAETSVIGQNVDLRQALDEAYIRIDERSKRAHTHVSGLPTGFVDLDELTAGLQNNELILIAARPSVGKTAFALNLLRHIVVEERLPALFVSLEQSRVEIAERLLCCQARVESQKLRKSHLSSEDMDRLIEAGDQLRQTKMFIDDTPAQSMLHIAAKSRRFLRRENIRVVVIDYLQLIEPENRRDPRQEQVAQISRRLKHLARELKLPVVALAQVNRSSEDRQDHRPRLADLRESGSLEQDADTVIMLHRPGLYGEGVEDNVLNVIIAKQRNGPTDEVTLTYLRQYFRYENFAVGDSFGPGG